MNIIDQCVAQGVPFAREYGGLLANRSFGGAQVSRTFYARGQTGQQLLIGAYSALSRQIGLGAVQMHTRHEMLDLVLANKLAELAPMMHWDLAKNMKANKDAAEAAKARIQQDPRTQYVEAKRERTFYKEQSQAMSSFIVILGSVVTVIFSIGAIIGAVITMYGAVSNRTIEIGTLRALGFRRRSILTAFLVESIVLSVVGGAFGLLLSSMVTFLRISTVNFGTFSELAFGFTLSPGIVITTMIVSIVMGIVGGFFPAIRAARMNIVSALRSS